MIEFRPGADRAVTRTDWLVSRHAFSFGAHYDPANTGFGPLVSCNEDTIAPGAGFDEHEHRGLEVVTWVLAGELRHEDDHGNHGVVRPGQVQLMRAGRGVVHAERNARDDAPVHLVQMWVVSEEPDRDPSYEVRDVAPQKGLVEVVSLPNATLHVATPPVSLPGDGRWHVLVTRGDTSAGGPGDAVRLLDHPLSITGAGELLVWDLTPG